MRLTQRSVPQTAPLRLAPDLQAALACEDVKLDANGFSSIVGVIHSLAAPAMPVRIARLCVLTRWAVGCGKFVQRVRLLTPDMEKELAWADAQFEMQESDTHSTQVAFFGWVECPQFGDYPIEVLLDGELKIRFPLRIVRMDYK
ncbi:MAG: hypothetical protein V1746_01250 [bacterium]